MMIPHPLCGPRDASEFVYLGDASLLNRPDPQAPNAARQFSDYLFLRENPAGLHRELWYHEQGDRSWLIVTRNTETHEIISVDLAAEVVLRERQQAPAELQSTDEANSPDSAKAPDASDTHDD